MARAPEFQKVGVQGAKAPENFDVFGSAILVLSCPRSGSWYNSKLAVARALELEKGEVQEVEPPEIFNVFGLENHALSFSGSGS